MYSSTEGILSAEVSFFPLVHEWNHIETSENKFGDFEEIKQMKMKNEKRKKRYQQRECH